MGKVRKFFYELACWVVIALLLVGFWAVFGGGEPDERGTNTYRGVDL